MKRGEVYWADLAPRSGSEQTGQRPVILVSDDGFNQAEGWRSVIVVPVTRQLRWLGTRFAVTGCKCRPLDVQHLPASGLWLRPSRALQLAVMIVCLLNAFLCIAQQQLTITQIEVSGSQRLAAAAVIAASGVKAGQVFAPSDLDRAGQKLLETGLFSSVNYRYDPAESGYVVTWMIQEAPANQPVRLDIPGLNEQQLWKDIQASDPLVDMRMPANEQAAAYYQHAIEAVLRSQGHTEPITVKTEADLGTGKTWTVFRPVNLPKVSSVQFSGQNALSGAALLAAVNKLIVGEDYSENTVRKIIEFNIRPLYEEKGYLTVSFPQVGMGSADAAGRVPVSVSIVEGPTWSLGKVEFTGEAVPAGEMMKAAQFPLGKLANWKEVTASIDNAERVLKHNGYLAVKTTQVRALHPDGHIVDLQVKVAKGPQYFFGALLLSGLDAADQARVMKLWKLAAGAPMDGPYAEDFQRAVFKEIKGNVKSINQELRFRPGTSVMDVAITFK